MDDSDWILKLKGRIKRSRRLGTILYWATDLLYLDNRERARFLASFGGGQRRLNVGSGFRASPDGFLGVDRDPYPQVAVVADAGALPFRDGTIDGVLCEQVLEHAPDAMGAIQEIARVLRPGGRLYVTLPFLWPFHASPHDYRRWTVSGAASDFAGFDLVALGLAGGPTTTLVNVLHEWLAIALSFDLEPLYRLLYLLLMPVLFPLKLLDKLLMRYRHAGTIGALFYVHARKRGA